METWVIIFIIFTILILMGIGIGLYFLLRTSPSKPSNNSPPTKPSPNNPPPNTSSQWNGPYPNSFSNDVCKSFGAHYNISPNEAQTVCDNLANCNAITTYKARSGVFDPTIEGVAWFYNCPVGTSPTQSLIMPTNSYVKYQIK